jgi:hypothetical protein
MASSMMSSSPTATTHLNNDKLQNKAREKEVKKHCQQSKHMIYIFRGELAGKL